MDNQNHQALYRRFRSATFDEVVGQAHITDILKNQIASDQISHAYLFCGPKGTGKTSTARIFAKAVNCLNSKAGEPCLECEVCKASIENTNPDIIEFDAASNRGIEDVRNLRENISYMPSMGRYRVYIIDEVHMMTTEAFNALLKTLEEPPEHAIFIFCTTEPGKLLPTILSRCQRFDFKRISIEDIIARLKFVLTTLGLEFEEEALRIVAENSEGALRDALSHLDKVVSNLPGNIVTSEIVTNALGIVSRQDIYEIAEAICSKDMKKAIEKYETSIGEGRDDAYVLTGLIEYFRELLIIKTAGEQTFLDIDALTLQSLKRSKLDIDEIMIIHAISLLSKTKKDCEFSASQRALIESAICYLCSEERITEVIPLKAKVERLELQISELKAMIEDLKLNPPEASTPKAKAPQRTAMPISGAPTINIDIAPMSSDQTRMNPVNGSKYMVVYQSDPKKASKDDLVSAQGYVDFSSKYMKNKDNMLLLPSIIDDMKVFDFVNDTIYIYPTNNAIHQMEMFEDKKGTELMSKLISQRLNRPIRVEVVEVKYDGTKMPEPKPVDEQLSDIFGGMITEVEE